jgi:hypothetical protein
VPPAHLLKFDKFLNSLDRLLAELTRADIWAELPGDLTSVISRHFQPKKCVSAGTIEQWTERPEAFFDLPDANNPASRLYLALRALSAEPQLDDVDTVKRRVYLRLFQNTREAFKSQYSHGRADTFGEYLFGGSIGDEKQVKRNCYDWSIVGSKYKTLADQSGGNGALLVPCAISRTKYVQPPVIRLCC